MQSKNKCTSKQQFVIQLVPKEKSSGSFFQIEESVVILTVSSIQYVTLKLNTEIDVNMPR